MIVLKGVLGEDGTIGNLEVYQGVLPEMDQAARLALSRWKFKPAMRADKPVSVEILVGIPAEAPASSTNVPSQQQIPPRQQ
jgi:outer membrane biosynthesis protein TonB